MSMLARKRVVEATEYTGWQLSISGVHSIMMEKSALAGGVGSARPPAFTTYIYYHVQSCVYASAERADTLLLFHLCPYMYSVAGTHLNYSAGKFIIIFLESGN
jgi:hypothetical protein